MMGFLFWDRAGNAFDNVTGIADTVVVVCDASAFEMTLSIMGMDI